MSSWYNPRTRDIPDARLPSPQDMKQIGIIDEVGGDGHVTTLIQLVFFSLSPTISDCPQHPAAPLSIGGNTD